MSAPAEGGMELKSLQEPGAPIYHMLEANTWAAAPDAPYRADSLATEGFIHLSGDRETLMRVANAFYAGEPGAWQILVVDAERLTAPLKWEAVGDGSFPHLFGPLNRDAVLEVVDFPRADDGAFLLPQAWR